MPWLFDFHRLITTQIYCCNHSLSSAFIALHPLDLHIYIYSNRHLNLWVSWQSNLIFIIYIFYYNSNISFPVNYQVVFSECSNTTLFLWESSKNLLSTSQCNKIHLRHHQFAASGGGRVQSETPEKWYTAINGKYFSDPYIIVNIILFIGE